MSTETPAAEPQGAAAAATPATTTTPAQEPTDWKVEARKWEARAKENSEAAKRLADLEEASKSEAQRQAERLAAAEAKVKAYESEKQVAQWAAEIVKDSPIPPSALRGSSRDELVAHFEQLKALIPPATPTPGVVGPYVPNEGKSPATGSITTSKGQQFAEFIAKQ